MGFDTSGRVVLCFWLGICFVFGPVAPKSEFPVFGRDQKVAQRKNMQIRGGITSGSAFVDLVVPI